MLAAVTECVADLSEKQCVQVLAHVMLMPDADLVRITVRCGTFLEFCFDGFLGYLSL